MRFRAVGGGTGRGGGVGRESDVGECVARNMWYV